MFRTPKSVIALDAVTATTTSEKIYVEDAKKITLILTRANHDSGSSAFSVLASIDGTTYITINSMIEDLANTNAQNYTRVASITLASDGNTLAAVDCKNNQYKYIKIKVTETTDGTHTAKAYISY